MNKQIITILGGPLILWAISVFWMLIRLGRKIPLLSRTVRKFGSLDWLKGAGQESIWSILNLKF